MNDSERWLELQRFYHMALELPPEERVSFVERASAHDEWLQRELESLLTHDQPGDDFLDQPAMDFAVRELAVNETEPAAMEPGSLMGPYKIFEQIAHNVDLEERQAGVDVPEFPANARRHTHRIPGCAHLKRHPSHETICCELLAQSYPLV